MKVCQYCKSGQLRKRGNYKAKTGTVQRYQCKDCDKTQTTRTNSLNYRLRKQRLAKKIKTLYCERMSLRGISRTLGIDRKTVNAYFIRESHKSRVANLKGLESRGIVSTFIQFDDIETFEHSKQKPLGIYLSVRAKTGEIISAKVHTTHIRALAVSKEKINKWNRNVDKGAALADCLLETKKAFNRVHTTLGCDGEKINISTANEICDESFINIVTLGENKKIDLAIRKMRNDISRLSRKSLCSTKKAERLQNHLDLYIDYHNKNRVHRQD